MIKSIFEKNFEAVDVLPIGEKAKAQFRSTEEHLRYEKRRKEVGLPVANRSYHAIVGGSNAESRMEYARNLSEIYYGSGVVSSDKFTATKISDLVSQYLGQTAAKARALIEEASGGFLFVDGVDLFPREDFSIEAVNEIFIATETERGKTVIALGCANAEEAFKRNPFFAKFEKFDLDL